MQEKERNEELEIDLSQLFNLLKKNMRLIFITTVIGAILCFAVTLFLIDKKYASTSTIILTPKITETGNIDQATLTTNSKMVNNYMQIIKGESVLSQVAEKLSITSVSELKGQVSVSNPINTEVIAVTATTEDPVLSQQIVEVTIDTFFSSIKDKLNIENMTIIDPAKVENIPVSPNKKMNTLIGALAGLVLSCGYVLLKYLLDKRLRTREEAENFLGIPVLVEIPFFDEG